MHGVEEVFISEWGTGGFPCAEFALGSQGLGQRLSFVLLTLTPVLPQCDSYTAPVLRSLHFPTCKHYYALKSSCHLYYGVTSTQLFGLLAVLALQVHVSITSHYPLSPRFVQCEIMGDLHQLFPCLYHSISCQPRDYSNLSGSAVGCLPDTPHIFVYTGPGATY